MDTPLHILHLEDNSDDALLIRIKLKSEGILAEITVVDNKSDYERTLANKNVDLILADYNVPGFDGLEALALTRAQNARIPFIFVTGALGEERAVETLRSGATDYVLKDHLSRLAMAIRRAIAEVEEHTRREQAQEALKWELAVNEAVSRLSTPLISPESSIEDVAEAVLAQALRLTDSSHGFVSSIDPTTKQNVCHTFTRTMQKDFRMPDESRRISFPPGPDGRYPGVWGYALNTRKPFIWNEPAERHPASVGIPPGHLPLNRVLGVPVFLGQELVGLILVANSGRDYTEKDLSAVSRLAEHYALGIQRLRFKYALQSERDFVQAILATAGALVVVLDTQGRIVRFNQACESTTGYTWSEVSGRCFWELFLLPEELESVRGVFSSLTVGQFPKYHENFWVAKDGSRHRIMWSNTVLLDENKAVKYVIATGVDVTQTREAEGKLRVLTQAIEAGPSSVVITNGEGIITYVNPTFANLTGYSPEGVIGQKPRIWKSGHHPPEHYAGLWQRLSQGLEWRGEFCNKKKDGSLFWIYATISPIKDEKGNISHYVAVTVDITERKRYEQALQQAREDLERKVAERTSDLNQTIRNLKLEVKARQRAENEIQDLLQFERLMTNISADFTNLQAGHFEEMMQESISRLAHFLKAERALVAEFAGADIRTTVFWPSDAGALLPNLFKENLPWTIAQLRLRKEVYFSNLHELPPAAVADRETYSSLGIQSFLALPLVVSGQSIGVLAFAVTSEARPWPVETLERMRLAEDLFAGLLVRWRSEKALNEAETRYHVVANFMQDWDYWESPAGAILFCSRACKRITGYGPEQFLVEPKLLRDIVHPEDATVWDTYRSEAFRKPEPRRLQFRIRRADGEVRWIEHNSQPVTDELGKFLGLRASNRDHTAEKQAELEGQRLREELARVTRITTADHLAASLAHELRQPLAAILSNAEAAEQFLTHQPPDLKEVQEALHDIIQSDERAGQVIQRLRALYRRTGHERTGLDLNKLVEETVALLRSELILRQVSSQQKLTPAIPFITANRVEMQQVLMNLFLNAQDAMAANPPETRQLVITTYVADTGQVCVSVCDSGVGLAPATVAHLFEPFFTTKDSGMGMGLAISRSIIEAHGGRMWAENNPTRGTTFFFSVPAITNPK